MDCCASGQKHDHWLPFGADTVTLLDPSVLHVPTPEVTPRVIPSKSSWLRFAEPAQTLIFLDWDDTLFPSTELFDRWGLSSKGARAEDPALSDERLRSLVVWRTSLRQFLEEACSLSDRCVIVTNAARPWVRNAIDRFAPELRELFDDAEHGPSVVYARDVFEKHRSRTHGMDFRPCSFSQQHEMEENERMMTAKYLAMKRECTKFYSHYPGQSWKNILSFGDMQCERDAVQEVAFRRSAPDVERLRTKTVVLPTDPRMSELCLNLDLLRLTLPARVALDDDLDINLRDCRDPLEMFSRGLNVPCLRHVDFPHHVGSGGLISDEGEVARALDQIIELLSEW